MLKFLSLLTHYFKARHRYFPTRKDLEEHQQQVLKKHLDLVAKNSSFYSSYAHFPLEQWPLMTKKHYLANFNDIITAKLDISEVSSLADHVEKTHEAGMTVKKHYVGISTGTSGKRSLSVVSEAEKTQQAGVILAKILPHGLFNGDRIAFFHQNFKHLLSDLKVPLLGFRFFVAQQELDTQISALNQYQPTVLVAPAQVLRALALAQESGQLQLHKVQRVCSVGEILEQTDNQIISQHFPAPVTLYHANEGFIAYTCGHGHLHLNEEFMHIEPEWIDDEHHRMVPIVTDLTRIAHPLIRYRLNDVLAMEPEDFHCPCGDPSRVIRRIEGRCDDLLALPAQRGGYLPIFPDSLSQAFMDIFPPNKEYRLLQVSAHELELRCALDEDLVPSVVEKIVYQLESLGIDTNAIDIGYVNEEPAFDPTVKRRRIVRESSF